MSSELILGLGIFFLIPFPLLHLAVWRATPPPEGEPDELARMALVSLAAGLGGVAALAAMFMPTGELFRYGVLGALFELPVFNAVGCILVPPLRWWFLHRGGEPAPPVRRQVATWGLAGLAGLLFLLLLLPRFG